MRKLWQWFTGWFRNNPDDKGSWVIIIHHGENVTRLPFIGSFSEARDHANIYMASLVFKTGKPQFGRYTILSATEEVSDGLRRGS